MRQTGAGQSFQQSLVGGRAAVHDEFLHAPVLQVVQLAHSVLCAQDQLHQDVWSPCLAHKGMLQQARGLGMMLEFNGKEVVRYGKKVV